MKYEYEVDSKLYENEIKNFIKNSSILKKRKQKTILFSLIIMTIAMIIYLIKSVNKNIYYIDVFYILAHIIIYIIVVIEIFVFGNFYSNLKERKRLFKYWKKGYAHVLEIEDEKIYFYGFAKKRVELNKFSLAEVKDLDNIFIILAINKEKKLCYTIIIPKDIFKSKEELSKFKNIIENILEK